MQNHAKMEQKDQIAENHENPCNHAWQAARVQQRAGRMQQQHAAGAAKQQARRATGSSSSAQARREGDAAYSAQPVDWILKPVD